MTDALSNFVVDTSPLITFSTVDALTSDEAIAAFLAEAATSNDADYLSHARAIATQALEVLSRHGK